MFLISTVILLCALLGFRDAHLLGVISLREGNPRTGEMAQLIKGLDAKSFNLSFIAGTNCSKFSSDL